MKVLSGIIRGLVCIVYLLIFLLLLTAAPILFGNRPIVVLSGSMEPAYPVGSITYYKQADFNKIAVGDAITFKIGSGSLATHRVVEIDKASQSFTTKGDNNDSNDANPVPYTLVKGKAAGFAIPYIGYLVSYTKRWYVIAGCAALLFLDMLFAVGQEKKAGRKETGKADNGKEDGRKTDSEKVDGRKADGRKADGRKADGRKSGNRKADGKKAGNKKAGARKADGRKADSGKVEGRKAGNRKAEGRKSGNRKADGKKAGNRKADGRKADSGKAEGRKAGNRKADGRKSGNRKADGRKKGRKKKYTTGRQISKFCNEGEILQHMEKEKM